jgi:hypothetical protein
MGWNGAEKEEVTRGWTEMNDKQERIAKKLT